MSLLSRAWMAVSVAVVNGHTDQSQKFPSDLRSLHQAEKRFSAASNCRPLAGVVEAGGEEQNKKQQAEESLRQVMYLNCWGQN